MRGQVTEGALGGRNISIPLIMALRWALER
jgi:hypothetical protein